MSYVYGRTSQPEFLVTKNNAIRNCYVITLFTKGQRPISHLSIGDVTRDDSQRRLFFCAQYITPLCCDIMSNGYNIVPTLLRCVALKIFVVNRLV